MSAVSARGGLRLPFLRPAFLRPAFLHLAFLRPAFLRLPFLPPAFLRPAFLRLPFLRLPFLRLPFLRPAFLRLSFLLLAAAMATTAAAPLRAAPFAVHVSLTPPVIGLDETATLTIEAAGGGIGGYRFEPTYLLENLAVAGGPSRFDDISVINGSLSRSYRVTLLLRPLATGPARVRQLVLSIRGQLVRLPDQEIRVQEQPGGQPGGAAGGADAGAGGQTGEPEDLIDQLFGRGSPFSSAQRSRGAAAFLRAELQPPRPLAGEQAIYTIYLYSRQDVSAINPTAVPSFQGFWVRDLPQPDHYNPEMFNIGDDRYGRVPILRKALFALRPGRHVLEPAACDVVVEPPGRGFFGPPVPLSEELHLRTPELAVEVQPLPPAPAGFGGLVGQVSLTTKLQPYKVHLGDGVTLAVTLAGSGHLQGVAAPRLDLPPGLTVFPPQQQSEEHVAGGTVQGRSTWTYVIVPTRPGLFSVRPPSVSYFDPVHGGYHQAESPALTLVALPAPPPAAGAAGTAGAAGATGGGHSGSPTAGLAPARGGGRRGSGPLSWLSSRRGWPGAGPLAEPAMLGGLLAAVAVLAVLATLAVLAARRRRRPRLPLPDPGQPQPAAPAFPARIGTISPAGLAAPAPAAGAAKAATTPAPAAPSAAVPTFAANGGSAGGSAGAPGAASAARQAPPPPQPREVEQKLREAAREDRPRHAAALVEEGWRGYLAGRWGLPATTPPARWGAVLAARGVASEVADEVTRLVEELHYLRYAPQLSTTGAVRDQLLTRSRQLLRRLR